MKTSEWKNLVKNISKELEQLIKEEKEIKKINAREYEKLGIKKSSNPFDENDEYEKMKESFPMYTDALRQRRERLAQIEQRKRELNNQMIAIKCVALTKTKKLDKRAERNGFLDNKAYAESLLRQHGVSYDDAINYLNSYFKKDNFAFEHFEMSEKEASFVGRVR